MADQSRVVLQSGSVHVDADPGVLAALFHNLITNKDYRKAFERDPVVFLAECGVQVPADRAKRITPQNIDAAIAQLGEGGAEGAVAALVAPGVGPAIRVGTRPGTRPGVSIGVRVATGSSTFAADPRVRTQDATGFDDVLKAKED